MYRQRMGAQASKHLAFFTPGSPTQEISLPAYINRSQIRCVKLEDE